MSFMTYWKDLFLHNSVFMFLFYQLKTHKITPCAKYFKNKLEFFISNLFSGSSNDVSEFLEKNYLLLFQSILAIMTILTLLSIIRKNSTILFVHSLIFFLLALITYNPMHPENRIEAHYGLRKELLLSVGIFIVRIMNILDFKTSQVNEQNIKQVDEKKKHH